MNQGTDEKGSMASCRFGAISVHGPIPTRLYRAFSEEWQAKALLQGDVFVTTLGRCRQYEKKGQGDPWEAREFYAQTKTVHSEMPEFSVVASRLNVREMGSRAELSHCASETYIWDEHMICMTECMSDEVIQTFGRYYVGILDPLKFFKLVSRRIFHRRRIAHGGMGRMVYRSQVYADLDDPPGPLGYVKDPDVFSNQQEIRIRWDPAERPP